MFKILYTALGLLSYGTSHINHTNTIEHFQLCTKVQNSNIITYDSKLKRIWLSKAFLSEWQTFSKPHTRQYKNESQFFFSLAC